ncbi:hypothetical protein [Streptomyces sp. BH104]|uniref:hypothetical protein n=1 Tax=Streptomyces sp. BH104 TaxID=3410407 RepID=UPI003BB4E35B
MVAGIVVAAVTGVASGGLESGFHWAVGAVSEDPTALAITSDVVDPQSGCEEGGGHVFPETVERLSGFRDYLEGGKNDDRAYLARHRATPANYRIIRLSLQSRTTTAIIIDAVHIKVKKKLPVTPGTHIWTVGQCGDGSVRNMSFDLDRSPTSYRIAKLPNYSDRRQLGRLPATVTPGNPETMNIIPYTYTSGYQFTVSVHYIEAGKRKTWEVRDNGKPFAIMSSRGSRAYVQYSGEDDYTAEGKSVGGPPQWVLPAAKDGP